MAMSGDFANTKIVRFADKARQLARIFSDSYRPELHYMRGPGPKWREKHGLPEADASRGNLGLPRMSNARA